MKRSVRVVANNTSPSPATTVITPGAMTQKRGAACGSRREAFPQDIDSRRFYPGSGPAAFTPSSCPPWTLNALYYTRRESAFRRVKGGLGVTSSRGRRTSPGAGGSHPAAAEFHIYHYLSAEAVSVLYVRTAGHKSRCGWGVAGHEGRPSREAGRPHVSCPSAHKAMGCSPTEDEGPTRRARGSLRWAGRPG